MPRTRLKKFDVHFDQSKPHILVTPFTKPDTGQKPPLLHPDKDGNSSSQDLEMRADLQPTQTLAGSRE
ncbi:MAG: hypothetical protein R3B83_02950 [Nitrospirales bacterium]|nr:hypothetical protein [Nitrospirales bacterium]